MMANCSKNYAVFSAFSSVHCSLEKHDNASKQHKQTLNLPFTWRSLRDSVEDHLLNEYSTSCYLNIDSKKPSDGFNLDDRKNGSSLLIEGHRGGFKNEPDGILLHQSKLTFFPSTKNLLLFLTILSLISNQNALLSQAFGDPQRVDNSHIDGINPTRSPSLLTSAIQKIAYSMRLFSTDPMQMMPSTTSANDNGANVRLTNLDQLSSPQEQLGSWTSMLFGQPKSDLLDEHIKRILVPRVSGTQGNVQVRQYIVDTLKNLNYHVELDEFVDQTPVGQVPFANIIASSNPNACRQLVLACHHDSKMMDGFLGATDSAVPCAMLLMMAQTFKDSFRGPDGPGLRFIFFDGEEAYVEWGPFDSLYGSRHLAAKWEKQPAPAGCKMKNELSRIDMLILLDLIGSSDTSFVYYNHKLKHHYMSMIQHERNYLSKNGYTAMQVRREAAFRNRYLPLEAVQDDHVPFMRRGVPILSLLAHPFPKVWHTVDDNYDAIDLPRTRRILHVLEAFVANYSNSSQS